MFQSVNYNIPLSIKLSEVMEDIGINEEMVMKRRRVHILMENIRTVTERSAGKCTSMYHLGSQSEGTTTKGLDSDLDTLLVYNDINVVLHLSKWKQYKKNYLMIQDKNATPGYCFLLLLRPDVPIPATHLPNKYHIRESNGMILLNNTFLTGLRDDAERQGPSNAIPGAEGFCDMDIVTTFHCNSWPQSASNFLEKQGRWPSSEMIRYAAGNGCFVVSASSKISKHPDLEWRISTSMAERCLIFNLNITQLHCYVLMKMILKTFLNPRKENGLSSFMCKTVLFHCIGNTEESIWMTNNLSKCLTQCLLKLHSFIQNDCCPHFMIPENNLMAGQFTVDDKHGLLKKINDIKQSDCRYLFQINIDDISHRLQVKLNILPRIVYDLPTRREIHGEVFSLQNIKLAHCISKTSLNIYSLSEDNNNTKDMLKESICNLTNYSVFGNRLEELATHYLVPFLCSTLGSAMASSCLRQNNPVSPQALLWLSLGLNSDVTSGRLKVASVFYCTGDMCRAEYILRHTERQYNPSTVVPTCSCWSHPIFRISAEFERNCTVQSEDCIRHMTSFCIRFLPIELNCVPRELQYEMKRFTQDDMSSRSQLDREWMDFAVVDSLPFLYFLRYKIYGFLQRYQDQQQVLNNLVMSILTGENLGHKETALNLLGQCLEQENKPRKALQCFMISLRVRARNNAAKIHICCLLATLCKT